MNDSATERKTGCRACRDKEALGFDIAMALQPIVDLADGTVFAQEALVRGPEGESAGTVFAKVNDSNRYQFDQKCRVAAIELASRLKIEALLSINFMPNAVYEPERCIQTTLAAARRYDFPIERIIFEITESEKIADHAHLRNIVQHYKAQGFRTAIDDFGAGHSGLNLLAELQTDLVKLDMGLIRDIDTDNARQAIVKGTLQTCEELGIDVIAEGVESEGELSALRDLGIRYFQGYYFAKPTFQATAHIPPERLA